MAVADDDQRGEAEPAATLDHLGDAVDGDDPLEVVALLPAVPTTAATTVIPPAAITAATTVVTTATLVATGTRSGGVGGHLGSRCLLRHHAVLPFSVMVVSRVASLLPSGVIRM
jgi:hypothetical protein